MLWPLPWPGPAAAVTDGMQLDQVLELITRLAKRSTGDFVLSAENRKAVLQLVKDVRQVSRERDRIAHAVWLDDPPGALRLWEVLKQSYAAATPSRLLPEDVKGITDRCLEQINAVLGFAIATGSLHPEP